MAGVSDRVCAEHQKECRRGIYKAIQSKLSWAIFVFIAGLFVTASSIFCYKVFNSQDKMEATITKAAESRQDARERTKGIEATQEAFGSRLDRFQASQEDWNSRTDKKLDEILSRLPK